MIVRDFHVQSIASSPSEADSPLVVDANAVLPRTVALKRLQAVPGNQHQIVQHFGGVEHFELSPGNSLNHAEAWTWPVVEKELSLFASEAPN
ncbi:MAG TPA: hypothetical protein VFE43_09685, partial [Candidatus Binataceae bacterium]|nr:hypothetical protein [Candidatus Binataceae bacterium]